ncbi:GYD domain-containing protein [Halomarina oriensis]|uniref:GYD domain-containing protein n=1 Tax=Halomarina oriensis TaxID=671145 RepID=A0A6B0GRF7_9EURY|nr:GYD domain-containing protein [Halomarina oriensis]MWG36701.1 GYD domain-containing protein [Halomarina oriensis]
MGTYMALVDVVEARVQNAQELASVWGDLRNDIADVGGEMKDAYAILGDHDYLILFEAPDHQTALQISLVVERRGLDMHTHELLPVEEFGSLVQDV